MNALPIEIKYKIMGYLPILDDNSGNQNLGFVISDKKVTFDERTTSVKKTKRFDSVKRNKSNGAF